jgi:sarcosine oxidase
MKNYDAAVLGLGTMGSAAVMELARRKARVIGFDQLSPPHSLGSHGGQTRVFRAGYAESPAYVPLVHRAGALWESLGQEFGTKLLTRSGLLTMGLESSDALRGIQLCADLGIVDINLLSAEEIRHRYPAFHVPDDFVGLLEPDAGYLDVDSAITGMQKKATELGAALHLNEAVVGWDHSDNGIEVHTATQRFRARSLIVTAGAWTKKILRDLHIPIRIVRKTFIWFNPVCPDEFSAIPIFGFPENAFYGFPNIRREGVKVSQHWGGEEISRPEEAAAAGQQDIAPVLQTSSKYLPGLGDESNIMKSSVCLYSMTPDEHFIIDVHPQQRNVAFAAGFSGHGFKFAPVIGEALADLALQGETQLPIDFLRWKGREAKWKQPV